MSEPKLERYIPHPTRAPHGDAEWQKAYEDIQTSLVNAVQKVEYEYSKAPLSSHDSVYIGVTGARVCYIHLPMCHAKLKAMFGRLNGSAGLAMMQYALASRIPANFRRSAKPEDVFDPKRLRREADRNLYSVIHQNRIPPGVQDSGHASFLETPVGNAAMLLARCVGCLQWPAYSEDEHALGALRRHWDAAVYLLYSTVKKISAEDEEEAGNALEEDGGSEVLYGRAGFLYALLYLRKVVDEAKNKGFLGLLDKGRGKEIERITRDSGLRKVVTGIIRRGKAGARRYQKELGNALVPGQILPPLMWRWHGKAYLGGAHGVCEYLLDIHIPVDRITELTNAYQSEYYRCF